MSNNEQYTEKTVDFKAISSYKKNVNVLNKLAYDNSTTYHQLMTFLKPFKIAKDDKSKKPNVTSPTGRYLITDDGSKFEFLNYLQKCYDEKLVLHFRELQHTDYENNEGSGIMLDFDIYQDNDLNPLEKELPREFCKMLLKELSKMIDGGDRVEAYVGLICKPKLVYLEDKKLYKNGFHVIIPNIWLSREQKKLYLKQILNSKSCNHEFTKMFNIPLNKALDMACSSVPVYFLHNCKEEVTEPYVLRKVYKFVSTYDYDGEPSNDINDFTCDFPVKELSISFGSSSIKKEFYKFNSKFTPLLDQYIKSNAKFEDEKEYSQYVFDHHNSYCDENLEYYRSVVMDVLHINRATDREMWRDVVFAIANINKSLQPALKEIARQFSMRCKEKYDTDGFESLWNDAINSNGKNKLTFNSLVYWAKEDNKAKYNELLDKDIRTTIELDVYSSDNKVNSGSLFQYHFAYYIYHLFKHKFACDSDGKNTVWYEFVMENDSSKKGELYKWRHETRPDNLIIYMSNRLPDIVSKVIEKATKRKETATEENIIKYIEQRTELLRRSAQGLYKTDFKNGIIKEAESLFKRRGFIESLDRVDNVFGVANGILVLDKKVKFIQGFHDYPVSLYTTINYSPFDINKPSVQTLLKVILSMFPEDEMDMFHYLMYFFSTCLDNMPKDSIFLILQGSGCHGIDTLIKMSNGINKKVQDIEVGDKLMGDDGTERNVIELFRGQDDMYKITPIKGESPYVVNKNHVMSLKNKENEVIDIKLIDYLSKNLQMKLYNSFGDTFKFTVEYLGKGDYYGFELDGNHRYLTADHIVHHNSNGKSSLLELAKTVLGQYGSKVSMSVLTENRSGSGSANEQMMAYMNARLAFYSETNKQEEINCATAKELTSQESITTRGIYQKQVTFRPKCNHVITTNFLPIVKTTDYGTWRRLKLYMFKMSFKPAKDVDPNNKYEKVADEKVAKEFSYNEEIKEAFLALLVEYYKDFRTTHDGKFSNIMSPTLEKDSASYRKSMDTMNRFCGSNIIISKDSTLNINEIVDAYISYLTEEYGKSHNINKNEVKQIIQNSELSKFMSKDNTARIIFKGIRIFDSEDEDERLLAGEYFFEKKNEEQNFAYDISNYDPLGLGEWRKNNM